MSKTIYKKVAIFIFGCLIVISRIIAYAHPYSSRSTPFINPSPKIVSALPSQSPNPQLTPTESILFAMGKSIAKSPTKIFEVQQINSKTFTWTPIPTNKCQKKEGLPFYCTPTPTDAQLDTPTPTETPTPTIFLTHTPTPTVIPVASRVLLVDDDDNYPDVRAYYTEILSSLNVAYDVWDTQNSDDEPDVSYLSSYSTVIWFTGDAYGGPGGPTGPGARGESALGSFLDSGTCLLISSQDYFYDKGLTTFMSMYLGVDSIHNDVNQKIVTGEGFVLGDLGTYILHYPFDNNYSDVVSPNNAAELAFSGDQGNAAIDKESGIYRTMYWGFPFEALPNFTARLEVMSVFLKWCESTFLDVKPSHWAWESIEAVYASGITTGCNVDPLLFCPDDLVTRAHMAVFLERGMRGEDFIPPPAEGIYEDVPVGHWAARWIEQLTRDGITSGCSINPPQYCPETPINRAQMAIFLEKARHWPTPYLPPPASGTVFDDVPAIHWAAAWIERLAADGITGGCSTNPPMYCPESPVTRAQMAVFLVRTFNLPMP